MEKSSKTPSDPADGPPSSELRLAYKLPAAFGLRDISTMRQRQESIGLGVASCFGPTVDDRLKIMMPRIGNTQPQAQDTGTSVRRLRRCLFGVRAEAARSQCQVQLSPNLVSWGQNKGWLSNIPNEPPKKSRHTLTKPNRSYRIATLQRRRSLLEQSSLVNAKPPAPTLGARPAKCVLQSYGCCYELGALFVGVLIMKTLLWGGGLGQGP